MNKNQNFAERMALAVAERFGDFGFDDIKDAEVREYLHHALALQKEKKPLTKWQVDRKEAWNVELERLRKELRSNPERVNLDEPINNLERALYEFNVHTTSLSEAGKRARELEPNLATQFVLNAAERQIATLKRHSASVKKRKISEEKK